MYSFSVIVLALAIVAAAAEITQLPGPSFNETYNKIIEGANWHNINGADAQIGQFPHQVSLRFWYSHKHFCSGSIIADRWILTAAHCLEREFYKFIFVAVGSPKILGTKGEYRIVERHIHPDYNPETFYADIAILGTGKIIEFNDFVKPIALPTVDTPTSVQVIIAGWGFVEKIDGADGNAVLTNDLQYLKSQTISKESCQEKVSSDIPLDGTLCHLSPLGGACNGDSGKLATSFV